MLNITKKDLTKIKEPLRYTGGEYGEVIKNESEIQIRVALCYPNLYDIGMNNYTTMYLYSLLNSKKGIYAERFFMPDLDIEKLLINNNQNLFYPLYLQPIYILLLLTSLFDLHQILIAYYF